MQKKWMPTIQDTNCLGDVYWLNFVRQAGRLSEELLHQAGSELASVRSINFQLRKPAFFGDRMKVDLFFGQNEVAVIFKKEEEVAVSGWLEVETASRNQEAILAL